MQIPQVVAHRGYSARWPENTVASCRAAIAAGADFVEADVRFSADGTLFCFHDPVLSRLIGSSREIAACPDAELRAVRYAGEAPAAFVEIVAEISGKAGLLVDVKLAGEDVLQGVHRVLEAAAWPENVWLGLRSAGQAEAARALFGDRIHVLALLPDPADAEAFLAAGADALRLWEQDIGAVAAAELQAKAPVWVTAGKVGGRAVGDVDAEARARILAFGPAAVLVNDPVFLAGSGREHAGGQ